MEIPNCLSNEDIEVILEHYNIYFLSKYTCELTKDMTLRDIFEWAIKHRLTDIIVYLYIVKEVPMYANDIKQIEITHRMFSFNAHGTTLIPASGGFRKGTNMERIMLAEVRNFFDIIKRYSIWKRHLPDNRFCYKINKDKWDKRITLSI